MSNAPTRTVPRLFVSVATLPQVHAARRVYKHLSGSKYVTVCGLDIYDAGLGLVTVHKGIVPISCRACKAALDTSLANH